jgi:flagellar L-ring protein precursor FlgH
MEEQLPEKKRCIMSRKFFTGYTGSIKAAIITAAAVAVLGGCAKQPEFEPEAFTPSYRNDMENYRAQLASQTPTASLWADSGIRGTLFLDYKARQIGDIIVVNIIESSSATNSNTTSASKASSNSSSVTAALGLPLDMGMKNFLGSGNAFEPTLGSSSAESFAGAGSKNKSDVVNATIAARVIDVLPSGNLVIEGYREIVVDQEKQIIRLTGLVRQKDITADNTVPSTAIADARISYSGRGMLSDSNKKGWLSTVLGWVWPF